MKSKMTPEDLEAAAGVRPALKVEALKCELGCPGDSIRFWEMDLCWPHADEAYDHVHAALRGQEADPREPDRVKWKAQVDAYCVAFRAKVDAWVDAMKAGKVVAVEPRRAP